MVASSRVSITAGASLSDDALRVSFLADVAR
jgi:hypothetical protein